jgi:hypothetical protein
MGLYIVLHGPEKKTFRCGSRGVGICISPQVAKYWKNGGNEVTLGRLSTGEIVNTSGKAGAKIPHLPVGDNALCAPPYEVYTAVCNKSLTATYQYKISNPSNKVLVNNIL